MNSIKSKTKEGVEIEIIISDHAVNTCSYQIGAATDLEMIITDVEGSTYEATTFLKKDWSTGDLQEIITTTILNCDAKVKEIKATIMGVISSN